MRGAPGPFREDPRSAAGTAEAAGGGADVPPELPGQVGLVVEPDRGGDVGRRPAREQHPAAASTRRATR